MTTVQTASAYQELCALCRQNATIASIGSLLGWDQETYMPPAAAEHRAEQAGMLSTWHHERITSPRIAELLAACEADAELVGEADSEVAANLREIRRLHDRATKVPTELVAELARVGSRAQEAWKKARAASDFVGFAPWLERMFELTRRKADHLGAPEGGELYDALLDDYEPGARAAEIQRIFTPLAQRLSGLVKELKDRGTPPDTACLELSVPEAEQHTLGLRVLKAMGFDMNAGRLDTTTHPFCSGLGPGDTRLTTRYRDSRFTDALYGTMHEGGHGLYDQGLPKETKFGLPCGDDISLGIHESQSRMWENFVGRSREFWQWAHPLVQRLFGDVAAPYSVEDFYRAVNTASPSLIRVEADEATYNLHVMLRFEIERALIRGDLAVADIPAVWNRRFEELLGVRVPDDARGCLQDVHWSFGLIGYFPTYTLGNLYAAQLWETIRQRIPDLSQRMARGDFLPLKVWLNENVHAHGMRYRAADLCERLTGAPLSADPLLRHLEGKLRPIYGV